MKSLILVAIAAGSVLSGCSAIQPIAGANQVELVNARWEPKDCKFLGEIVGSQGNWWTGDITSNEDLMIGARNELRNKAYQLGANRVSVQNMTSVGGSNSLGTDNTTIIGKAYFCNTEDTV